MFFDRKDTKFRDNPQLFGFCSDAEMQDGLCHNCAQKVIYICPR